MKKYLKILLWIFNISVLLTACGGGIIINGSGGVNNTMDCNWDGVVGAEFLDVNFLSPCNNGECENQFLNSRLENVLNSWRLYSIMYACRYGILGGCPFDFKWTVTVVADKTCSVSNDQSKYVMATQDDFEQVFTMYYQDFIESPRISTIPFNQFKHKFEFQIHEIENEHDHTIGTIKWEYTWLSPTAELGGTWYFTFPQGEMIGTYTPNSYQPVTRHIYINGQYEDI